MDIWEPEHVDHEHDFDVHQLIKCRADTLSRLESGYQMLKSLDGKQEYITVISMLVEYETLIKLCKGELDG